MTTSDEELKAARFWLYVDDGAGEEGCWSWLGQVDYKGYGRFSWKGKVASARRIGYGLSVGAVPHGLDLLASCANKGCVNPSHLTPVSRRESVRRGNSPLARHASKTHCSKGHSYDDQNTRVYRGRRYCRECQRIDNRSYRARRRELTNAR